MKRNIVIRTIGIMLALALSAGCDSFLDTEQKGVTTQQNFYQTDEEAEQAVYAIYKKLRSGDEALGLMHTVYLFVYKNILSDDAQAGGTSRSDNTYGNEMNEFLISPSNNILKSIYMLYYQVIYCANQVIQKVEEDTDTKKLCVAEAKALRALAYFELTTVWGPVPLVTEPLEPRNYNQSNSTVAELYAQIEKDLQEAIAVLPLKSEQSAANKARVSKGAAQAWLGKAYLYQKKYDEAAKIFDVVINSGQYSLHPVFAEIFRKATEFGSESLFEISYQADLGEVTVATAILAWGGPNGSFFSAGTTGITESGWGWCPPEKGLREAFVAAGDDKRRKATVLNEEDMIALGGSMRDADGNLAYGCDGLVRMKYGGFLDEIAESNEAYHVLGETNYRLMRYADVLLMAAEANNRNNPADDAKAAGYVNQVRRRVDLDPLDATITGNALFEAIKLERRLELAFEFVRFQDLVRWGDAATVLKDSGKKTSLGVHINGVEQFLEQPNAGFKSHNNLMPFPDTEIAVNPNIVQNPEY